MQQQKEASRLRKRAVIALYIGIVFFLLIAIGVFYGASLKYDTYKKIKANPIVVTAEVKEYKYIYTDKYERPIEYYVDGKKYTVNSPYGDVGYGYVRKYPLPQYEDIEVSLDNPTLIQTTIEFRFIVIMWSVSAVLLLFALFFAWALFKVKKLSDNDIITKEDVYNGTTKNE